MDEVLLTDIAVRLPERPVIVELGAHYGETITKLLDVCDPVIYVAVEADPRNEKNLRLIAGRHITAGYHVFVRAPLAVVGGNHGSMVPLFLSRRTKGTRPWTYSSTTRQPVGHLTAFPAVRFDECVDVPATHLERLLEEHKITGTIDLLWMDIEGAEREVLESLSSEVLARIQRINMESHPQALHDGAWSREEAVAWLTARGFSLVAVADQDIFVVREP